MDERVRFVGRLLDGEGMSDVCREFGISRKTGYKLINHYNDSGVEGLADRSRRPYRHANASFPDRDADRACQAGQAALGAPKIRERLARLYPDVRCPAISTVHAVLDRHGLVKRRKNSRFWCADTSPACPNLMGTFLYDDKCREVLFFTATGPRCNEETHEYDVAILPTALYWQQFEELTVGMLREVYNVANAQQFGRPGQAQQGVDVYGKSSRYGMIGIQCKLLPISTRKIIPIPAARSPESFCVKLLQNR